MKPPPFQYHAPRSLEEALALKAEHGEEATILAGGQSLMPLLALRLAHPAVLIDLNRVAELEYLRDEDGRLVMGAMTRHRAVEELPDLEERCPMLADALPLVGHPAIRNRGTVGGSMAHADPAAEWPALAAALDGVLEVRGPAGGRTIDAADFFLTHWTNALAGDEILTEIRLRLPGGRVGSSFVELARRYGDFALAGVGVVLSLDEDEKVRAARIALLGLGETPIRVVEAEVGLQGGRASDDRVLEAAAICRDAVRPTGDIHASAEYRKHLAWVLSRRALVLARQRAGG